VKYKTLAELKAAVDAGEVAGTLTVDNDDTYFYTDGDDGDCVFRMHPADLTGQALDLLGIPHEEA
jgi:hypothetical protein